MSKQTEALKLAREMLIDNREYVQLHERHSYLALYDKAIARVEAAMEEQPAQQSSKPLTDEQIQDLLCIGNPTEDECRLIRLGWNAAHGIKGDA